MEILNINNVLGEVSDRNTPTDTTKTEPILDINKVFNDVVTKTSPDVLQSTIQTDLDRSKYEEYMPQVRPEFGIDYLNKLRAENQSNTEQFFNMGKKVVLNELVAGTVETIGAIPALVEGLRDEYQGKDADFNNFMMEWAGNLRENVNENIAPIYRENPNESFDFGDWAYFMDMIPSVVSSFSMMLPSWGLTKSLSASTKLLANAAGMGKKLEDISGSVKETAKILTSAGFMRNAENVRESAAVYKSLQTELGAKFQDDAAFNEFLNGEYLNGEQGSKLKSKLTGDTAKDKQIVTNFMASHGAWVDYGMNSINYVFDIMQLMPLYKGAFGFGANATRGSRMTQAAEVLAEAGTPLSKGEKVLRTLYAPVILEQLSEGVEEMVNTISEKEAKYNVLSKTLDVPEEDFGERINNYLSEADTWEAGMWGVVGGVAMSGLTRGLHNITGGKEADKIRVLNQVANLRNYKPTIEAYEKTLSTLNESLKKGEITEEQYKRQYKQSISPTIVNLGMNHAVNGTMDILEEYIVKGDLAKRFVELGQGDIKNMNPVEINGEIINSLRKVEDLYNKAYEKVSLTKFSADTKVGSISNYVSNQFQASKIEEENNQLKNKIGDYLANSTLITESSDPNLFTNLEKAALKGYYGLVKTSQKEQQKKQGIGTKRDGEYQSVLERIGEKITKAKGNDKDVPSGLEELVELMSIEMYNREFTIPDFKKKAETMLLPSTMKMIEDLTKENVKLKDVQKLNQEKQQIEQDYLDKKITLADIEKKAKQTKNKERKKALEDIVKKYKKEEAIKKEKENVVPVKPAKTEPSNTKVTPTSNNNVASTPSVVSNEVLPPLEELAKDYEYSDEDYNYATEVKGGIDKIDVDSANKIRNAKTEKELENLFEEYNLDMQINKGKPYYKLAQAKLAKLREELANKKPSNTEAKIKELQDKIDSKVSEFAKSGLGGGSSLFSLPIITPKQIMIGAEIVADSFRLGFYKFKQIWEKFENNKNINKDTLNKELWFTSIKSNYVKVVNEKKSNGEDVSMFDNVDEINDLLFTGEGANLDLHFPAEDSLNGFGRYMKQFKFKAKQFFVKTPFGYSVEGNEFIKKELQAIRDLREGDTVQITVDKEYMDKQVGKTFTYENVPLKIVNTKATNIELGYLNDITTLREQLEEIEGWKDMTKDQLVAVYDQKQKVGYNTNLILFKIREVTGTKAETELDFDDYVRRVLQTNYNHTLKIRKAFEKAGINSGIKIKTKVTKVSSGEFAKVTDKEGKPTTVKVNETFGDNIKNLYYVQPDVEWARNSTRLINVYDQNKDFPRKSRTYYRNIDAAYTNGFIYVLVDTMGGHKVPVPIKIESLGKSPKALKLVRDYIMETTTLLAKGVQIQNPDLLIQIDKLSNFIVERKTFSDKESGTFEKAIGTGFTVLTQKPDGTGIPKIEFNYFLDGKQYKANLYDSGKALTQDEEGGYFLSPVNNSVSIDVAEVLEDGTERKINSKFVNSVKDKAKFKEVFDEILVSLPRTVNFKKLAANESVTINGQTFNTYQDFLNATDGWSTNIGKVVHKDGTFIGYTTPFGNAQQVISYSTKDEDISVESSDYTEEQKQAVKDFIKQCNS